MPCLRAGWRCSTSTTAPATTRKGIPGSQDGPAPATITGVALLQADGNYDLERGNNRGDGGDAYPNCTNNYLDSTTTPDINAFQNGNIVVDNKAIYGISSSGSSMYFSYGVKPAESARRTSLFSDDFESDQGWITNSDGTDTATTGMWERANPESTGNQLGNTASGSFDLVTQAQAGSGDGSYDIDNRVTSARSPDIRINSGLYDVRLSFWYYHSQSSSSSSDFLRMSVVGSGGSRIVLERSGLNSTPVWASCSMDISGFAGETIHILIDAADGGNGLLVEAGIDDLEVSVSQLGGTGTPPAITTQPSPTSVIEGDPLPSSA